MALNSDSEAEENEIAVVSKKKPLGFGKIITSLKKEKQTPPQLKKEITAQPKKEDRFFNDFKSEESDSESQK